MQKQYYDLSANGGASWIIIIVALIVFWPVGVYLLYRKLSADRVAKLNDGKMLRISGVVLIVIGGLQLLQSIFSRYSFFSGMPVFYLLGGCALFYVGNQMRDTSARYRKYIDMVANQGISDISTMASLAGVDSATCTKDLQKMIDSRFFSDAFIDYGQGRLVIQPKTYAPPAVPVYSGGGAPAPAAPRAVRCPGCGANNTVIGSLSACEYCGSPLS